MIRTAKDVIAVAKARGYDVILKQGPPIMPVLRVPAGKENDGLKDGVTETLLGALRAWRADIIEELSR